MTLQLETVEAAYKAIGLVDITPERCKYKTTRHYLDPKVSDMLGLNGHKMRVYYTFNPVTGVFRRRKDEIIPLGNGTIWRKASAYPLNRRKTVWHAFDGHIQTKKRRDIILEFDIAKQMQLAASAILSYRKKRGVMP
jgi:hypothetical protein